MIAPCTGEVLASENELPDRVPLDPDPDNRMGNHVVLFCKDHSVVLSHFQNGSVLVAEGDMVTTGQLVGKAGNSGMSIEPHFHIHAVRGWHTTDIELKVGEDGIPMTFDGRFLKNNWFTN